MEPVQTDSAGSASQDGCRVVCWIRPDQPAWQERLAAQVTPHFLVVLYTCLAYSTSFEADLQEVTAFLESPALSPTGKACPCVVLISGGRAPPSATFEGLSADRIGLVVVSHRSRHVKALGRRLRAWGFSPLAAASNWAHRAFVRDPTPLENPEVDWEYSLAAFRASPSCLPLAHVEAAQPPRSALLCPVLAQAPLSDNNNEWPGPGLVAELARRS